MGNDICTTTTPPTSSDMQGQAHRRKSPRLGLLILVLCVLATLLSPAVNAQGPTSSTSSRAREEAILPPTTSSSSSSAAASSGSVAGNATVTSSGNATLSATGTVNGTQSAGGNSTNATSTSSRPTSDATKPFATEFTQQTAQAPAPAGAGGGNVAQSPDDSYIAKAERNTMLGLTSIVAVFAATAFLSLLTN